MNMFKNNGGFTLVELIVVIAILAILAGVAVPAYSGYISKANEASDMTQLDSMKTAAVFSVIEDQPDATVTKIVFNGTAVTVDYEYTDATGTKQTVTAKDVTADVKVLMGNSLPTFKSKSSAATWCLKDDAATTDKDEEGWNLTPKA